MIGIPAITTGDDQVIIARDDEDFFRMFEGKIDLGQQRRKGFMDAQPDRPFRQGRWGAVQQLGLRSTDFFDVGRQFCGGLSRVGRSILVENDRCYLNIVRSIDEDKISPGGKAEREPDDCDEKRWFHELRCMIDVIE